MNGDNDIKIYGLDVQTSFYKTMSPLNKRIEGNTKM